MYIKTAFFSKSLLVLACGIITLEKPGRSSLAWWWSQFGPTSVQPYYSSLIASRSSYHILQFIRLWVLDGCIYKSNGFSVVIQYPFKWKNEKSIGYKLEKKWLWYPVLTFSCVVASLSYFWCLLLNCHLKLLSFIIDHKCFFQTFIAS